MRASGEGEEQAEGRQDAAQLALGAVHLVAERAGKGVLAGFLLQSWALHANVGPPDLVWLVDTVNFWLQQIGAYHLVAARCQRLSISVPCM